MTDKNRLSQSCSCTGNIHVTHHAFHRQLAAAPVDCNHLDPLRLLGAGWVVADDYGTTTQR